MRIWRYASHETDCKYPVSIWGQRVGDEVSGENRLGSDCEVKVDLFHCNMESSMVCRHETDMVLKAKSSVGNQEGL